MASETTVQAACHCRRVRFEAVLSDGLNGALRCNCSFCRMRGAVMLFPRRDGVTILSGADALAEYQFGSRTAKHYFCSVCGIYTHHRRRSSPGDFAVNAACIQGVSPFDFPEVPVNDGNDHPADRGPGAKARIAGVLRYEPTEG